MKITDQGKKLLTDFVREYARDTQNIGAWISEAEENADNMRPGETGVVIEVRASESRDKTTHDLTIPRAEFV